MCGRRHGHDRGRKLPAVRGRCSSTSTPTRSASNEALADFVDFYLNDAYTEAVTMAFGDTGYVELPDDQITATRSAWSDR